MHLSFYMNLNGAFVLQTAAASHAAFLSWPRHCFRLSFVMNFW